METEKQLVKDLNCLQETFFWSPGSNDVNGIARDFVEKSIIPSYCRMIERADLISKASEVAKTKKSAAAFIGRVNAALSRARAATGGAA